MFKKQCTQLYFLRSGGHDQKVNLVFAINISHFLLEYMFLLGGKIMPGVETSVLFVCSSDLDYV
jgi:hypothetical protein